jgi:hypothetical protein
MYYCTLQFLNELPAYFQWYACIINTMNLGTVFSSSQEIAPLFSFLNDSAQSPDGRIEVKGQHGRSSLHIRDVKLSDSGRYDCEAASRIGGHQRSMHLDIECKSHSVWVAIAITLGGWRKYTFYKKIKMNSEFFYLFFLIQCVSSERRQQFSQFPEFLELVTTVHGYPLKHITESIISAEPCFYLINKSLDSLSLVLPRPLCPPPSLSLSLSLSPSPSQSPSLASVAPSIPPPSLCLKAKLLNI